MKITLVIPTIKQGGAERVISELANEWASSGHKVNLILLARAEHFYTLNPLVNLNQLGFHNSGKFAKLISELKTFCKLRRLLRKQKPDFVLSFMEKYNTFTIMASAFLGLKIFVSDRSNPLAPIPKSIDFLRRKTYKYADGIIAQTTLAKEVLFKSTGNKNICVIPNPVKNIIIDNSIPREKIILNVGRLVTEKGQKFLIDAFAKIEEKADWKLVILGEGPLMQELKIQALALGVENQIFLPGAVSNVDEWLSRASIFAFPSISEGYPNALVEAMSAGLPCVSFDCDAGPRDIIKHPQNGILIKLGNSEELKNELSVLMCNKQLREEVGREALKMSVDLKMEKISRQFLDFCTNQTDKK